MNFADLGLGEGVLKAVADAGYQTPTPIQEQAIPVVLMGRDVLGCAQTGTGKTASFTLPMIDILGQGRAKARMPRSLILEPTRELAAQVAENFTTYGKYHKLNKALLIGGESMADQQKQLSRGVDVLIATPGRLLDLSERGGLLMTDVKILVIDEADRMLDMGFIPDIERIVGLLPKIRQTLFFSATMPPEIRRLADAFLMNPKSISVAPPATAAATVTQGLIRLRTSGRGGVNDHKMKREALRQLVGREAPKNALIFCNRKRDVGIVCRSLRRHGFNVGELHGDMSQPARTETLAKFKDNQITLLVCSDVAARGLDISALSHVFNYDVPSHPEDYVHRIGRTGRAGREGRAFSISLPEDDKYLDRIQKLIGTRIPLITVDGTEAAKAPKTDATVEDRGHDGDSSRVGRSRRGGRSRSGERTGGERTGGERTGGERTGGERTGGERDRNERNGGERPAASTPSQSQRRDGGRSPPRRQRDGQEGIGEMPEEHQAFGLGANVPAFLRRELPKLAPSSETEDADENAEPAPQDETASAEDTVKAATKTRKAKASKTTASKTKASKTKTAEAKTAEAKTGETKTTETKTRKPRSKSTKAAPTSTSQTEEA